MGESDGQAGEQQGAALIGDKEDVKCPPDELMMYVWRGSHITRGEGQESTWRVCSTTCAVMKDFH